MAGCIAHPKLERVDGGGGEPVFVSVGELYRTV